MSESTPPGDKEDPIIFKDELQEIGKRAVWFIAVAATALLLHFVTDLLEYLHVIHAVIMILRSVENLMFGCDAIVLFLYVVIKTLKSIHSLLLSVKIDIPKILKNFFGRLFD